MTQNFNGPFQMFSPIGLTLSGGGTRAAAFHLGCLSYLEHVGVLSQVKMLSTVSGGTFTGAKYVLSLVHNQDFKAFFEEFYILLCGTKFLREGLENLVKNQAAVPSGRQNAIISAAQVYADTLLRTEDGKPVLFGSILDSDIALQEVIFNATDFHSGIAFRFQKSVDPNAKIGNYFVWVPEEAAKMIRVADIVAASSCIPPGFEPMVFPDDFVWPGNAVPPGALHAGGDAEPVPVPLMDGGIYDNTGIDSLMLADRRQTDDDAKLQMVIISDVTQKTEKLHEYPEEIKVVPLTVGGINFIIWGIYLLFFISAAVLGYELVRIFRQQEFKFFWDFFLYLMPFVLVFLAVGALWWGRAKMKDILEKAVPQVGRTFWDQLKRLSLTRLVNMANRRYQSMFDLTASIFMKRIRQLTYNAIYADEKYFKKRLPNFIYHLQTGHPFSKKLVELGVKKPSPGLQKVIDAAAEIPTAMWFNNSYEAPCLVASGQATICYNLMKHVLRVYEGAVESSPEWESLVSDWNGFREDPYVLLRKLLADTELPEPP
jgi:predicted acylesterase/phospholipase RssA